MKKKNIFMLLAIVAIVFISGISTFIDAQTRVPAPQRIDGTIILNRPLTFGQGRAGGHLVYSSIGSGPATYNMSQSSDNTSSLMIERLMPPLFRVNYDTGEWYTTVGDPRQGNAGPGYSIDINPDDTMEITIHLRRDIYWSDGTRMTADEWVYFWNEITSDPDVGDQGYGGTKIEVKGVEMPIVAERVDRWTVKFIYPGPMGDPELPLSGGIMPMHIVRPIKDSQGADGIRQLWSIDTPTSQIIGYGPWLISRYTTGESLEYRAYERYFLRDEWNQRLPYLNNVTMSIVENQTLETTRFRNREIDYVMFPNSEFREMVGNQDSGGYTVWNGGPTTGTLFVIFNQNPNSQMLRNTPQLGWFTDKRFRQALNFMINKDLIVEQVLDGLGEPDRGDLHPASMYFDPNNTFPNEYSPDRGKELLAEMGIRDRDGDGRLEDRDGNNISFTLTTNAGNDEREQVISIITADWNAEGLDTTPDTIDFNTLVDMLMSTFDWEAICIGLTGGLWPASGQNVWLSSGGLHMWHPNQPEPATEWEAELDRLFNSARVEPDFEVRKQLWQDMYRLIYDQVPHLLLYRKYGFLSVYNEWDNVQWDTLGSVGDYNNQRLFQR